eukprot:3106019-Pleurochrysis_carterae.AAC.1
MKPNGVLGGRGSNCERVARRVAPIVTEREEPRECMEAKQASRHAGTCVGGGRGVGQRAMGKRGDEGTVELHALMSAD